MKSIITSAALLAATVSAKTYYGPEPKTADEAKAIANNGMAKVVNRCSYPVYLWSIDKQLGCDPTQAVKLLTGDSYQERMKFGNNGGISVKLSKTPTCTLGKLTQLEYKIDTTDKYAGNYLDMSFVDCYGDLDACPGRTDGYYMKAGNQIGEFKSAVNNEHCPVFSVANAEEAAKVAYIKWNDPQTKFCAASQPLDLYLCGGEAPGDEDDSAAPSSEIESSSAQPSSSSSSSEEAAPSTTEEANFVVAAAAAVTPAPVAPVAPVIKTEIVYVTEYINRRHAHGRRHHVHA